MRDTYRPDAGPNQHPALIEPIIACAQLMVILDATIVNVALPSIYKALHLSSTANLEWVITPYA